ncbi:MAG TPA: DinB family protein [Acidobacteriaceae bacterium]|nr:DinB family protein [Acidobacteriaceae bacterium]
MSESLLPEFDEEMACTRKFLELVPDEKLDWKASEKSMTLGQLAWHLSDLPEWCYDTLRQDSMTLTNDDYQNRLARRKGKGAKDIVAAFDQHVTNARGQLASATDADLAHQWKMEWGGQTVIDMPRAQVLRKWVMNHMIHHRAQMGVFLRLNGIAIPGTYGPSADEMPS